MIWVLGASGYIGQAFIAGAKSTKVPARPVSRTELDYADFRVLLAALRKNIDWSQIRSEKTRFCSLLSAYVNRTVQQRMDFFDKLNRRRKVDSIGRAGNNTGCKVPGGQ